MTEILQALGKSVSLPRKVWLLALFGGSVAVFLMLDHLVSRWLGVSPVLVQLLTWAAWFTWQGWAFGVNRQRYLRESSATAYRRAFYRDILPGVSFGISQMMVPATFSLRFPLPMAISPVSLVVAPLTTALGATLMIRGFKTIGFGGAGFLNEFGYRGRDVSDWDIYKYVRHPLFLGGILLSLGSACFFTDPLTLVMAFANVAMLPVYSRLEDRRLESVLGDEYREYASRVGAFIPRLVRRPLPVGAADIDPGMAA